MRRFWAHIVLAATALILMGGTFFSLFTKVSFNQQYTEGNEITYRLTDKYDESAEISDDAAKDVAEVMKNRLNTIGITEYSIRTVGNDIVKVQFSEPNNLNKSNIIAYLGFNGSLALSNMDDNENYLHITASKFLKEGSKAYLDSINNYPTVVIPIDKNSSEFQDLIAKTKAQKEAGIGEKSESSDSESEATVTTYLYLWYDFDENNDTYSKTQTSSKDYDINVAKKIMMKFNIEDAYYPDGQENKLAASLRLDTNGDNVITQTEVRNSYDSARFYVNLLNSEVLDYKVSFINSEQTKFASPTIESLVVNSDPHQFVAMSYTLIASIVAICLIGLFLGYYYHLSAIAIGVTSLFSVFTSIAFIVFMNAEFNVAAVIALIAVAIVSLASGIYYASKLKDEIYRGRSLKKANSEASRKTLMPTVDFHIALIVIGIFTYLFGGALMRTFSLVSVIGGLFSLILNLSYLRILFWLNTNNTAWIGKFGLFGVDKDKLPTLSEDGTTKTEIYKGKYAKTNFNKHSRIFSICSLTLLVASLAGLITFGVMNNGQPYPRTYDANTTQLYVYTTDKLLTEESLIENDLKSILVYVDDSSTKPLSDYVKSYDGYNDSETVGGVEKTTTYFEINLSNAVNGNMEAINSALVGSQKDTLDNILKVYSAQHVKTDISLKVGFDYAKAESNYNGIMIGCAIVLPILAFYFFLRYKLSKCIASLITIGAFSTIGFGFLSLTRLALPRASAAIIPLVMLFATIVTVIIMSREKEILVEDKARVVDFARRTEMMHEATSLSINEIGPVFIVSAFIFLFFAVFGPSSIRYTYLLMGFGFIIVSLLSIALYSPVAISLYRRLSRVENKKRKRKPKDKNKVVSATHRSREPEEAVFIGIND